MSQLSSRSCSVCMADNYSLRVSVTYNDPCVGCGALICLDCFTGKIVQCVICKSRVRMFHAENSPLVCDEMDQKYGKFECPTCHEKIARRNYLRHFNAHRCNCGVTCPQAETLCKLKMPLCKVHKHSVDCKTCKNKFCSLCNGSYSNVFHALSPCICGMGMNIMCRNAESFELHDGCNVFEQKSKKIMMREYCLCDAKCDRVRNCKHAGQYDQIYRYLIDTKNEFDNEVALVVDPNQNVEQLARKRKADEMS